MVAEKERWCEEVLGWSGGYVLKKIFKKIKDKEIRTEGEGSVMMGKEEWKK